MIRVIFFIPLVLLTLSSIAQNKSGYTSIYGGGGVFAKFNGDTTKPITGQLFPTPTNPLDYVYINGSHSCISDSAMGKLLCFTNSMILYDTMGQIMENGDSLQPNNIYMHNCCPPDGQATQGSLILPKGSNNLYYVITPTMTDSAYNICIGGTTGKCPFDLLQYHIVDMNANGGLGKVIQKNISLLKNVEMAKVGMMACRHANGYDWWLLKQALDTNIIYTFLVTKDTIILDTIQYFTEPHFGYYDLRGQSCFNNNGDKYAFATGGVKSYGDKLFIADFDRCTGILSNPKSFHAPLHTTNSILDSLYPGEKDTLITGLCFSKNDNFLYVGKSYNIYQYELNQTDSALAWFHVKHGPDTTFIQFSDYGQMQMGIDHRIYIGKVGGTGNSNSVINYPNLKGSACGFCRKCLRMDTTQWYTHSLSNMPDFNLGKKEPCWPLQNENVKENENEWDVYPNPTSSKLFIKNSKNKKIEMFNAIGQLIIKTYYKEIDVSHLSKGIYYLRCGYETKKIIIE